MWDYKEQILIRCPYCKSYNANYKNEITNIIDSYQCDDCKKYYHVELSKDKMRAIKIIEI